MLCDSQLLQQPAARMNIINIWNMRCQILRTIYDSCAFLATHMYKSILSSLYLCRCIVIYEEFLGIFFYSFNQNFLPKKYFLPYHIFVHILLDSLMNFEVHQGFLIHPIYYITSLVHINNALSHFQWCHSVE